MEFRIEATYLNEVHVIVPELFSDDRGFFGETFRADKFRDLGLPAEFPQDNHAGSVRGVVRGLHFQLDPPMGKLMRVTRGTAFMVAVDIRPESPTFRKWVGVEASQDNRRQIWAPAGFARGYCALSEYAEVQYKLSAIYDKAADDGIRWDDPEIGIEWPVKNPIVSVRDSSAPTLAKWLEARNGVDACRR